MAKAAKVQAITPFSQICRGLSACMTTFFETGWDKSKVAPELLKIMEQANEIGSIHLYEAIDKQLLILIATASDYATQNVENLQRLWLNQDNLSSYTDFIVNQSIIMYTVRHY